MFGYKVLFLFFTGVHSYRMHDILLSLQRCSSNKIFSFSCFYLLCWVLDIDNYSLRNCHTIAHFDLFWFSIVSSILMQRRSNCKVILYSPFFLLYNFIQDGTICMTIVFCMYILWIASITISSFIF